MFAYLFFIFVLKSSDSEDDEDDDDVEDDQCKTSTLVTKDDSTYLGLSNQGSDSQQNNCDMHFRLKTLSPTSSCVIS